VTAIVLTSTSAQLNWNAVSGAQGYRIYWQSGTQKMLLGTVGSKTTAVQIIGLTPGTTSSFMVEAYSGNTVADSLWIAVTTPAKKTDPSSGYSSGGAFGC
jgi:hypothetical protein